MKILMCINGLTKDGASRVFVNLAKYLANSHDILLCCTSWDKVDYEIPDNVRLVCIKSGKKTSLFRFLSRTNMLRKLINREKPNLILSFLPLSSYLTAFLKPRNTKLVISVRNDPSVEYRSILNKFFMNMLYPRADGFVFQTEDAKNFFPKNIKNKGVVIFNSLNPIFLESSDSGILKKKQIISVGRLNNQKNQKLLINAFFEIHKKFPDYKLVIYGCGELENELNSQIKDLDLCDFVSLPGIVDNIKDKLLSSKIFVLSSDYEGLPNALIEAMSLGLPCISSDCPCGGPRSLIKDNYNGLLFPVGNLNELIKCITKLIINDKFAEKIGKNALEIRDKLNPNVINKQWEDYLLSICDRNYGGRSDK